jgi:hypothetical protein
MARRGVGWLARRACRAFIDPDVLAARMRDAALSLHARFDLPPSSVSSDFLAEEGSFAGASSSARTEPGSGASANVMARPRKCLAGGPFLDRPP